MSLAHSRVGALPAGSAEEVLFTKVHHALPDSDFCITLGTKSVLGRDGWLHSLRTCVPHPQLSS